MSIESDVTKMAAEINAEIASLKADGEKLIVREKALVARIKAAPMAVVMRLDDFVAHEESWAAKHPWADMGIKAGIGAALALAAVAIAHLA